VSAPAAWPLRGGWLEKLGRPPAEIEAGSRARALALLEGRWRGEEAELAASLVYAAGDAGLVGLVELRSDPLGAALAGLAAGGSLVVDVGMVAAGVRRQALVATRMPGAERLALECGTTRAAAGMRLAWEQGPVGLVAVGNAPTALLAVLDLAQAGAPPGCVIATCPGFQVAAEAKAALAASGLPHLLVAGSRGGSGLAAAAVNSILARAGSGR